MDLTSDVTRFESDAVIERLVAHKEKSTTSCYKIEIWKIDETRKFSAVKISNVWFCKET